MPMPMPGWALLLAAGVAGAAAGLSVLGRRRWQRATAALVDRLRQAEDGRPAPPVDLARATEGLPAPVQRYLRAVLTDGAPRIRGVSLAHRGRFNLGSDPQAPRWKPFRSQQVVVTRRPGFVWDGRIAILPGLAARVHDAYVAGEGRLQATLAGLLTLADQRGGAALAEGELMRFLAESPWYPTVLLPGQGVTWAAVDEVTATATLRDGEVQVQLHFEFGADGLVAAVRADARGRTVGERSVPTPWEGRWARYEWQDGLRVPMDGEVAWRLPQGELPYWRGTVTALTVRWAR